MVVLFATIVTVGMKEVKKLVYFSCDWFSIKWILGQALVSIGISSRNMIMVLVGRFIFGLGGECLMVGQSAMVSVY